jgi:hypothetical protein
MVRFPRGRGGPRAWHAVREASGTWETLPPPPLCRVEVGCINRKKSIRRVNEEKGVRSSDSTLRR